MARVLISGSASVDLTASTIAPPLSVFYRTFVTLLKAILVYPVFGRYLPMVCSSPILEIVFVTCLRTLLIVHTTSIP